MRIGTSCSGRYSYNSPDGKKSEYSFEGIFLGSGYFINSDGYILTNNHVVEPAEEKGCKEYLFKELVKKVTDENPDEVDKDKKSDIEKRSNLKESQYYGKVLLPSETNSFQFKVKERGISGGGKDVAIIKIEITNAPVLELADSNTVNIQDEVLVIGYPTAADVNELNQESILEASVDEGKVSNPNKKLPDNSPVIQIAAPVANGSSGSPVLNMQGKVIGIITFGKRDTEGGTYVPFAIPARTLKEYITSSGISNKQGVVDRRYRQGLNLFWRGDFTAAKEHFESVQELFPQHSEAKRLIGESVNKKLEVWNKTNYSPWLVGIGAFITGGAIVLLVLNTLKRNGSGSIQYAEDSTYISANPSGIQEEPELLQREANPNVVTGKFRAETVMSTAPYIELKNQQSQVCRLSLQKERYQIGRDQDWSNIDIPDLGWEVISRHQAILKKESQTYRIFDGDDKKNSTNGIYINNNRIPQDGYVLKDGDELKIGRDPNSQVTLTYFNPASRQSVA
ncbi:MAG: hypothetical protein Fur006_61410 [Coleofasciculaceae cyanobacterium]